MKFCSNCGTQLPDDTKFCFSCGTPAVAPANPTPADPVPANAVPADSAPTPSPSSIPSYHAPANAIPPTPPPFSPQPSTPPPASSGVAPLAATITGEKRKRKSYDEEVLKQGVTLCDDGKYRWIYAMNMWKNPTILFVVVKIFFWVLVGILAFILLLNICENGWKLDDVWDITWPFLILMGVFAVLILIAYAIIAAMYGGKYIVLFTMDEEGVLHEQIASQAKKAQKIGAITAVAGALTGKPAMVGLGATSAARTSMSSDFSKVRSINPIRGCNVIKIREFLSTNHVYARDEDFDFVYNFIKDRCPRVK